MTENISNKALALQELNKVSEVARQWIEWDPNPVTRSEIQELLKNATKEVEQTNAPHPALQKLHDILLNRIAFGTAGLRSEMAAGYTCMNHLVIIQTSQGLLRYLQADYPQVKERGIVIGYDGRHNSRSFAETAAAVFLSQDIPVYLFSRLTCTPMVPFAVLELQCAAGVMVTASHNPKDDNGYKVYWRNGAQIIPPHDSGIAAKILENVKPWKSPYTFDIKHPLLRDPTARCTEKYFTEIEKRYCWEKKANEVSQTKVTFTPMHGVGAYWTALAFKAFGLPPFIPVKEQIEPDPDFPTVKFPNPEEGKGALALAIKTAEANGSRLIIANDPDADRLAVAERDTATGTWTIFNGNQIAALFGDWVWQNHLKRNPQADHSKYFMVASTVSSKFLQAMARKEGFVFADTLTGFKWMGNVATQMEAKGLKFLFAYEVEIGFLVGNLSYDKDGVRTAAIFAEMANQLYLKNDSCVQHLQALYKKYGYFEMNTSYFFCYTQEGFQRVFGRLRTANNGSYVDRCGQYKIKSVRDVTKGFDSAQKDGVSLLPAAPDSQMLTFYFENGAVATLRNSGTEPKLKYYVECHSDVSQSEARRLVDDLTATLIAEFLQPEKNGLVPKKVE